MAAGTSGEATGPADGTLVYLVRHGQTPLNESGVLRGLLDPPLDEAGHLQGRAAQCGAGPPNALRHRRQPAAAGEADGRADRRPRRP